MNHICALEALLFIHGEALSFATLQKILQMKEAELKEALKKYEEVLASREGGLTLIYTASNVRLGIKNEYTHLTESLAKNELQADLSKAALEVLALVAYLAPVARVEIDAIRGVNSSFTLRNLALRGLIERKGNHGDSRGFVYEPSMDFLTTLGIENVEKLPEYQKLRQDDRLQTLLSKERTDETRLEETEHEKA